MNKKENMKKMIFLVIGILLILGFVYYQTIWKGTEAMLKQYDTENLNDRLFAAQVKAKNIANMKEGLEQQNADPTGLIADYNNLQNEIQELNRILGQANTYTLDFEDPTIDKDIVRRNIEIEYWTGSYETAKSIMQQLEENQYKCLLRDVEMTAADSGLFSSNEIVTGMRITFYENAEGIDEAQKLPEYEEEKAES